MIIDLNEIPIWSYRSSRIPRPEFIPLVHLKLRPSQVFLKKISALILFWPIFILRYASRHSRHTLSLLKVKRPKGTALGFFYSHELANYSKNRKPKTFEKVEQGG